MPRLSDETRRRRRDEIAAAAMRCFARDGFSSTSMADIIREAGSSAGSVYSHFESKADLVRYVASGTLTSLSATISEELPSDRIPSSVVLHLLRASAGRQHARTLLQIWAEAPRDPGIAELAQETTVEVRALVVDLLTPWCRETTSDAVQAESRAEALSDAVLTALQGFIVRLSIDPDVQPEALAERIAASFADVR